VLERERLSDGQKRGGQARAPLVVLLPVELVTAAAVKSLQEVPRAKRGEQLSKESARGRGRRRALQRVAR